MRLTRPHFRPLKVVLALLAMAILLLTTGAQAASYLRTDGLRVDPIQYVFGGDVLYYSGPNLEPGVDLPDYAYLYSASLIDASLSNANMVLALLADANLSGADLRDVALASADLSDANLTGADLTGAFLHDALLQRANLTDANLSGADLYLAYMGGADLSGADLTGATYVGAIGGTPYYDAETDFTNAWEQWTNSSLFDPVAAGWTFVPEPTFVLLQLTALLTLAGLRRRARRPHPEMLGLTWTAPRPSRMSRAGARRQIRYCRG